MSILAQLNLKNIPHAVLRSEWHGHPDWFVLCLKSSAKHLYLFNAGTHIYNRNILHIYNLNRQDIYLFYELMHRDVYIEVISDVNGLVYEQKRNGLKEYLKKTKIKKLKKTL
jgi:hypothetical protein